MNEAIPITPFNSLLYPASTVLVTSCDKNDKPNIITIAWITPLSAMPPLLAISIRPERYSYGLIIESGEFVVNLASYEIAQQTLFCGRYSGKIVDKFAVTGLTPLRAQVVRPPIIQECYAYIECKLKQEIEAGDHNLLIGEVLAAYVKKGITREDGLYDLNQAHPLMYLGKNYFTSVQPEYFEPKL